MKPGTLFNATLYGKTGTYRAQTVSSDGKLILATRQCGPLKGRVTIVNSVSVGAIL